MAVEQRLENVFPDHVGPRPRRFGGALAVLLVAACFDGLASKATEASVNAAPPSAITEPALPVPPPTIPPKLIESRTNALNPPALRPISAGVFGLGEIRLDRRERTVTFPAVLNMVNGPLEYLLVNGYGKKHESLLVTEVPPFNIHLAMLLLDVNAPTNQASAPPPAHLTNPSSESVKGIGIAIELSWQTKDETRHCSAEQALLNRQAGTELTAGAWVYNGSAVWDGHFLAQREGSIASLVTDLAALINNNGPGHDNDHIWEANAATLPAVGTPVTVTMRLLNSSTVKTSPALSPF